MKRGLGAMTGLADIILEYADTFLLVFVRMTGLFVIAPVFGRRNAPVYLKVGFAFFSAIIVLTAFQVERAYYDSFIELAVLIIAEFVTGITLGFISYMLFSAIYVAGQLIDMQIGFGMVNVINPMHDIQVPITANFYYIISILVFLVIKGPWMLIKALYESYRFVPIGGITFSGKAISEIISLFGEVFIIGFRIAAPITASILIANVALGVISKAVPQVNIFILGLPVKIALGIAVMLITIPLLVTLLEELYGGMGGETLRFLESVAP